LKLGNLILVVDVGEHILFLVVRRHRLIPAVQEPLTGVPVTTYP
jgi:hypothetical protein